MYLIPKLTAVINNNGLLSIYRDLNTISFSFQFFFLHNWEIAFQKEKVIKEKE